jgi:predicted transport protein
MGDIHLFSIKGNSVDELEGTSVAIEKSLQVTIEKNLETFLGIRYLDTEYSTGKTHGGRIDTLGIDENGCPVIIEYKRASNENVINQGLFYLDWLLDHKAEFQLKVQQKLGHKVAEQIEWSTPRLLCIAGDFTKYDIHAVQQIHRNIGLIRYRKYEPNLLLLELVNATIVQNDQTTKEIRKKEIKYKTISEYLTQCDTEIRDRYESLKAFIEALGDDVQTNVLKFYIAFKRIKNFACVEIHPQQKEIRVFVKVSPDTIQLEEGFTRDVRDIGHYGTGDLEIIIKNDKDLEKSKNLIIQSYDAN